MVRQELATQEITPEILEQVIAGGDLSKLSTKHRVEYYRAVCDSLGINGLTKPFDYIWLGREKDRKLVLYANRECTDQLRKKHSVSIHIIHREYHEDLYIVTAEARLPDGRTDSSIGAVVVKGLAGEGKANALMKAETKAKRRATLSIIGLGWLDEAGATRLPDAPSAMVQVEQPTTPPMPVVAPGKAGEVGRDAPSEDYGNCPEHGDQWKPGNFGEGTLYHYYTEGKARKTCQPHRALQRELDVMIDMMGITPSAMTDLIKERFGGRTWSKLIKPENEAWLAELDGRVKGDREEAVETPANVDPDTGQILEEAPEQPDDGTPF